jgi:phosphonopyruvate decarboxylase
MIDCNQFVGGLAQAGIGFVTGVPDSLLKNICACITDQLPKEQHIIAANEGAAVAMAIGHYLATQRPALVYMQNSGLGNAINPLVSLADPLVYGIPMVLMIGWRGEILSGGAQAKDEPQHKKQGLVTLPLLETLGIPHVVVDGAAPGITGLLADLAAQAIARPGPVALVVRKDSFAPYSGKPDTDARPWPSREEALRTLLGVLPESSLIVATTGYASRELFELRRALGQGHDGDFLCVGGMGHASQIAAGIALAKPERLVVCVDGDGAMLMHTGALAASAGCRNLLHVVINNGSHESVGGQPTMANVLTLAGVAQSLGYELAQRTETLDDLRSLLQKAVSDRGGWFIEVMCRTGARSDLGRPDRPPAEAKADFMAAAAGS